MDFIKSKLSKLNTLSKLFVIVSLFVGIMIISKPCSAFVLAGNGWDGPGQGSATVNFFIDSTNSSGLSDLQVRDTFIMAMQEWANVADIWFVETDTFGLDDSLDISFDTGGNLDVSGRVAFAYFPDDLNPEPLAGTVHFDDRDPWEVGNALGTIALSI